jgi:hypothetical protein
LSRVRFRVSIIDDGERGGVGGVGHGVPLPPFLLFAIQVLEAFVLTSLSS